MNITLNSALSATLPASTEAPAPAGAAPLDGIPLDPALAAAQASANPLAFLQFLQLDAAAPAPDAAALDTTEAQAGAQPQAAAPEQEAAAPEAAQEAMPEQAMFAALSMPSMMAMPVALPAAVRAGAGLPEQPALARRADSAAGSVSVSVPAPVAASASSELPLAALPRAAVPADQLQQAAVQAPPASEPAAPAPRGAAAATPSIASAPAPAAPANQPAAPQPENKGGGEVQAPAGGAFGVAAAAPATAPRETATVALSGPPTAWRQTLQQALGERLNVQIGQKAEQAVIRLEPPMLGRVEISIRHAAGSLEVNISATHGEVLRQLNTVSEQLRNDLAGRQYSEVSVNVTQAPRAQALAQSGAGFNADAQGRGRQQDQQQDQQNRQPGAALLDAHQPDAAFSLNARA